MIHVSQDYNKYAYRSFNDGFKGDIEKNIYETSVKDFDCKIHRPQRAGVIMYTIINDEVLFGMGLDTRTHDITDFGGGVSYKIDKNAIIGALREFREETLEIFNKINMDDIMNSKVIYDENNLIIFEGFFASPLSVCSVISANLYLALSSVLPLYKSSALFFPKLEKCRLSL